MGHDRRRMTKDNSQNKSPARVLYALGPGDVVGLCRDLLEHKTPAFQIGKAFSTQFLDWCDASGAEAHLVSWHARRDSLQYGRYRVENLPKSPLYFDRGIRHHIGAALYGLKIVAMARRERPTVVIADSGTTHWIVLALLPLFRIPVIAVLFNSLWPMGFPPTRRMDRLLRWFDGFFFRHVAAATVCMSPECARQVLLLAPKPKGPLYQFRPQYRRGFLERAAPVPPHSARPFRDLFLGRIEEFKGVFMILDMAERLEKEMPGQFAWKIVGSGPAFEELQRQVAERKLSHIVEVPGRFASEQKALEAFGWAHAGIVPTTSKFIEGFAMTAAESVLAGRPVVVSAAVPAWEVLGRAAIVAETDNVDSFVAAFKKLAIDPDYYAECQRATLAVQEHFYDASEGLGAALGQAITNLR